MASCKNCVPSVKLYGTRLNETLVVCFANKLLDSYCSKIHIV